MATKKKKKSYIPLIITLALVAAAIVLIVISSLHPKGTDVKVEAPVLQDIMRDFHTQHGYSDALARHSLFDG